MRQPANACIVRLKSLQQSSSCTIVICSSCFLTCPDQTEHARMLLPCMDDGHFVCRTFPSQRIAWLMLCVAFAGSALRYRSRLLPVLLLNNAWGHDLIQSCGTGKQASAGSQPFVKISLPCFVSFEEWMFRLPASFRCQRTVCATVRWRWLLSANAKQN